MNLKDLAYYKAIIDIIEQDGSELSFVNLYKIYTGNKPTQEELNAFREASNKFEENKKKYGDKTEA